MLLNSDQLLEVFMHLVLTKIMGKPNLESITLQQSEHNGNLASIKSNLGNGLTGLMVISMKPEIFATIHPDPFAIPPTRDQRQTLTQLPPPPQPPRLQISTGLTPSRVTFTWSLLQPNESQ